MTPGLVPADYLLGFLGKGPSTRMGLIATLMARGYPYAEAENEAGQAIMALVKCGRIESFGGGDVWRLTASAAQMTGSATPEKRAGKAMGGYKQYDKAAQDDKTPPLGHPGLSNDGTGQ